MSYSKDEKDWLGRDRTGHFDDQGNKIGTSKEESDWLGRKRTVHKDSDGNKTGYSKEEKDWLGNDKTVHYDKDGNKSGSSKVEKDWLGKEIIQHYDKAGNKTGQSSYQKDWLGRTILKHGNTSYSGASGLIGVLILIALVVIVVLGTFSFPYKLIDSDFQPFQLNWTDNRNVWIFSTLIWCFIVTSLLIIKALFQKSTDDTSFADHLISTSLVQVLIFCATLPSVAIFILKSKLISNFLPISISFGVILGGLLFYFFSKNSNKIPVLVATALSAGLSIFYLVGESHESLRGDFSGEIFVDNNGKSEYATAQPTLVQSDAQGAYQQDFFIDEAFAKDQYDSYNAAFLNQNPGGLNSILSEKLDFYMGERNVLRSFVVQDKESYMSRWRMISYSILSFSRLSNNVFEYRIKMHLEKNDNSFLRRDFLLVGKVSFDNQNLINGIQDFESIGLYISKELVTENLQSISGTSWVLAYPDNESFSYITFNTDNTFSFDLESSPNFQWKVEEDRLLFSVEGVSSTSCVLENGILNCNLLTESGSNISCIGKRKK